MIPSTRARVSAPPEDDVSSTEAMNVVAASEIDTGFDQENLPEVVENEDGTATVLDFPPKKPRPEIDESDFSANLAESLDESELSTIAGDLLELIERDKKAVENRDKMYAEGLKRSALGEDAPGGADFEGASKVSHPVLTEACVDFEARAIKELYPPNGPVKTQMLGGDRTPKRLALADQKKSTLNWVLSKGSPEYKGELEQTLSQVPMGGSQYFKVRPELHANKITYEFVPLDDVWVAFGASNFYTAQRVTHRQLISRLEFEDRVTGGLYRDVVNVARDTPRLDLSQAATANQKIEGVEDDYYNQDGLREIYEVYTWHKVADDEFAVPYIIHIDETSRDVLGIYRNWAPDDEYKIKLDWLVEFGLIPWRGPYKLGLPHLIGKLASAATGALRALLDTAHLTNVATLVTLGGARRVGQNVDIAVGQATEIQGPPDVKDIRNLVMAVPFNPPSPVLFQLLGFLVDAAKGVVTTAEEKISDATNNMPVGTSLALIEQGSKVYASIHARLHDSQAKVLEITCRLLATYPELLKRAKATLGDKCADAEAFRTTDDICPVSDPNIFSEAQRFAQLQAVMQMQTASPNLPWNALEINRRGLQLLNFPDPDGVLPPATDPVTADPVNENAQAVLKNAPLRAAAEQDHLAHLREHLRFLNDPMGGANAVMPGAALGQILSHCVEHLAYLYISHVAMVGPEIAEQALAGGHKPNADTLSAAAAGLAADKFGKMPEMEALIPLFTKAEQMVKSKQPPTPMDPTMATMQAAKMETDRQTAKDQADAKLKAQELQQKATEEQNAHQQAMQKMATDTQALLQEFKQQAQDALDKHTQASAEDRRAWEEIRQGWANIQVGMAKVGIEKDGQAADLNAQAEARLDAPDPKDLVAPVLDKVDDLSTQLDAQKDVAQATQDAQSDHHDDLLTLLKPAPENKV